MSSSLTVCQYAVVKKETRSEWLNEISNYGILFRRLLAEKAANYFRHGLMLLWFTDLIDVTEEVTIRRPNVSTYLPFLNEWKSVIKTARKTPPYERLPQDIQYQIELLRLRFTWKFEIKWTRGWRLLVHSGKAKCKLSLEQYRGVTEVCP